MTLISNNTWQIKYYDLKTNQLVTSDEALSEKIEINKKDIDIILQNGLFSLRRPGKYTSIGNLIALPPKTSWDINERTYTFNSEVRKRMVPSQKDWDEIEELALNYLRVIEHQKIAIELSGGLDTSVVIEFFRKHKINCHLIGFTSNRWEFRTERAIQEYYLEKNNTHTTYSYESCPSFDDLTNTPPHPLPQQESLFYKRHMIAAEATKIAGCKYLMSGEAGDQIFGFPVTDVYTKTLLPGGYGYWSLAEIWNAEFVYKRIGIEYISALGVGNIPSFILSRRNQKESDHMKLWIRNELNSTLPTMLSKYAYKGFHDGWVSDGLRLAEKELWAISCVAYQAIKHESLEPEKLIFDSKLYSSLSEDGRKAFLLRLATVNWIHSLYKNNFLA
jgi:hypothetical protein